MGLCLRLCVALLLLSFEIPQTSTQDKTQSLPFKQADVCELLRGAHEELLNEYPNEYYDCHAHSRFDKLGAVDVAEAFKAS